MADNEKALDPSSPRSYGNLILLMDNPDALGLNRFSIGETQALLEDAQTLPPGPFRVRLLTFLDKSLSRLIRQKECYDQTSMLQAQLRAEKPDLSEFNSHARAIESSMKMLRKKFTQTADVEKGKGIDLWKTAWPWYEHELYCHTDTALLFLKKMTDLFGTPESPSE